MSTCQSSVTISLKRHGCRHALCRCRRREATAGSLFPHQLMLSDCVEYSGVIILDLAFTEHRHACVKDKAWSWKNLRSLGAGPPSRHCITVFSGTSGALSGTSPKWPLSLQPLSQSRRHRQISIGPSLKNRTILVRAFSF